MKKAKGSPDNKQGDSAATGPVALSVQAPDGVLPPPGIQLPADLAPGAAPAPKQTDPAKKAGGAQAAASTAVTEVGLPAILQLQGQSPAHEPVPGQGDGGKGGRQAAQAVGEGKAASLLQTAQLLRGAAAAKGPQSAQTAIAMADDQPQTNAKADFNALVPALQGNQSTGQNSLIHDLATAALDKNPGLADKSPQMGLDTANILNNLSQAPDKLNPTQAAPPAISLPLKTPQWGEELSNRVMWMVQHDVQTANIKINPPHLGPLEVQVSMNKDHVDVSFNSHHAAVKDALDASIPKLKEMLGSSGLQLGDANVTHHSFSGQSQYNQQSAGQQNSGNGAQLLDTTPSDSDELVSPNSQSWDVGSGAIDFYA